MVDFNVTILGCGSAKPTLRHQPSSQIVNHGGTLYMIDCGEGTQMQLVKCGFRQGKLRHVFISHSHGDHCLGLIPMLSSFALEGRSYDLNIYAPSDLIEFLQNQISFFIHNASFEIIFHSIDCQHPTVIHTDSNLKVTAFPLDHRVPCYGFLFQENMGERHIKKDCITQYHIPYDRIKEIKCGADYTLSNGVVIPNADLTDPPASARSYAYCSDTRPVMRWAELLNGVDLLYHEATYSNHYQSLAVEVFHSTAEEAATFAVQCHAKRLLLGHFSSRLNGEDELLQEALRIFPNTSLADEGMEVRIG